MIPMPNNGRAILSYRSVNPYIFFKNSQRFLLQPLLPFCNRMGGTLCKNPFHTINGPEKVYGSGSGGRQRPTHMFKMVSKSIVRTLKNREFSTPKEFRAGLASIGVEVSDDVFDSLLDAANTSWKWSAGNYSELLASDFTGKILVNTAFYVVLTLFFNVGLALVLALVTFYMPSGQSKFFRALWLIPRVSPSVIYVMLWKWLTFDGGFMSYGLGFFGVEPENWLNSSGLVTQVTVTLMTSLPTRVPPPLDTLHVWLKSVG